MNGRSFKIRLIAQVVCSFVASFIFSAPQNPNPDAVVKAASSRLTGQVMSLRHLYAGSTLKFDENGKVQGQAPAGEYTLHSHLQITRIAFKSSTLVVRGHRVGLIFDNGVAPRGALIGSDAEIQIAVSKSQPFDFDREFQKAFLGPTEKWPENMPAHWERYVKCGSAKRCLQLERAGVAPAGTKITPKTTRQPQYNDFARKERVSGQLTLSIIVEPDGTVSNIQVVRPLGLGLEKQAVETVRNWKFDPPMRDLKPVATYAEILLTFNLK